MQYGLFDIANLIIENKIDYYNYIKEIERITKKNKITIDECNESLIIVISTLIFQNQDIKNKILPIVEGALYYTTKINKTNKDEKLINKYSNYSDYNKKLIYLQGFEVLY